MDYIHAGEEAGLAPSYALFLTGCNLACLYCYTVRERAEKPVRELTAAEFGPMLGAAAGRGARNVNIIGGEPTVNLPALLRLFAAADESLPLVWNTNAYAGEEAIEMLAGIASTYLMDLKFGNSSCAARLADTPDYCQAAQARIRQVYDAFPADLIVRHVVMPGHLECCARPVLAWFAENLPAVRVNLLTNYTVMPQARLDPELGRFLRADEVEAVFAWARELGLAVLPPATPAAGAPAGERPVDAEIVIRPDGQVHLRHPTGTLTDMLMTALQPATPEDKERP